jgi:hypothetical protein
MPPRRLPLGLLGASLEGLGQFDRRQIREGLRHSSEQRLLSGASLIKWQMVVATGVVSIDMP